MTISKDLDNALSVASTVLPLARTTTVTGTTVDLKGYDSAAFVAHVGTITDGTHAFDPEESDDDSSWDNIAAADLSGSFTSATSSADDTTQLVAYLGGKRYVRCNIAVSGSPSTGGAIGVVVIRGLPRVEPL